MKTINHSIIFCGAALLVATLLTGCTSDIEQEQRQDLVPVQLTASSQDVEVTLQETNSRRAANNLYTSTSGFDGGESVKVWMNSTSTSSTYTINSTDHTTLQGGSLYYPAGSTGTATVFALYPSTSTSSHTVAYNQSGDAAYKQSDLMYATKTVNLSEKTSSQALQFSHQLVKLHVNIVKGSGVTSITSVKMKNVNRTVSVTPANTICTIGEATAASDGNGNEIIIFSGSSSDATQDYACVFPIQAWNDQDFIEITADDQTATYKLTRDSWTKGSSYTLTLNVSTGSLGTTTSITGWNEGASATIGGGGDFTMGSISAVTYDGTAKTPTPTVSYNNNTLTLDTDYTLEYAGNTNAGTAAVIAIGKGTYVGKVGVKEFTINKAAPTYTAPTAATLTYNGSAQNLVTAGSTSHGTIKYSTTENGDYSATIPQQTNAGTYNVWWKLEGDENHNDVAATQVTGVSIAKANCSVVLSANSLTIAPGSNSTFTVTLPTGCNGTVSAESSATSVANTTVSQSGNSATVTVNKLTTGTATITVTVAESDNYNAYTTTDKQVTVTSNPLAELTSSAVGKLIGADGNVYATATEATNAGTSAIAMIVYVGNAGTADASSATYKGLAIALTDASTSAAWYGTSSSYSSTCVYQNSTFSNHYGYADMKGIQNTNQMADKTGNCASHTTHAAATAAKNYSSTVAVPANCSQWFLPSSGQWFRMFRNATLNLTWSNWGYSSGSGSDYNKVNKMFTDAGANSAVFSSGASYWSSSEYDASLAVLVYFYSSRGVYVGNNSKSNTYRVRAFLAF